MQVALSYEKSNGIYSEPCKACHLPSIRRLAKAIYPQRLAGLYLPQVGKHYRLSLLFQKSEIITIRSRRGYFIVWYGLYVRRHHPVQVQTPHTYQNHQLV